MSDGSLVILILFMDHFLLVVRRFSFEGKPVRTPDAGTFWRVIADHRVNVFFTAPTAFRAIRKEDPEAVLL